MFIDHHARNAASRRRTGYVQQEDIHHPQSTVREALRFSALLRQSNERSTKEKLEYVNTVIEMLDMESYADAVVGVPGEGEYLRHKFYANTDVSRGLNVEQRKRLTIAVELAARPPLLLFLGMFVRSVRLSCTRILITSRQMSRHLDLTAKPHGPYAHC
jgi:ATP-binding cassette subfamily G (WHITE) protein 2 (PDR)